MHHRDNIKLINALKALRDLGNSVIVVEHDKVMMMESDYVIDLGPGAGIHGGLVVAQGPPSDFRRTAGLTADYLNGKIRIEIPKHRRNGNSKFISLKGVTGNNLIDLSIKIPLEKMICVTGVSGSGKSTLIHDTLYPILNNHFYRSRKKPMLYRSITGITNIDKVIEVDQSPIGRTPRSNPATYTGMFTYIRNLFAQLPEAKIRGYKPGRFSFNVKDGRCETCKGAGLRTIEMNLLPDVYVKCEICNGNRYSTKLPAR